MFGGWGIDGNAFVFECGDVIFVPRFEVTDFKAEIVVVSARSLLTAGAFGGPGFIRRRGAARTWSVRIPARERMGDGVGEIWRRKVGFPRGFLPFHDDKAR